jgi:Protein of unknown function (DUF3999)
MTKLFAGLLLLVFAAPAPEMRYFRYQRPLQLPAGAQGQACLVLDPSTFSHAAPGLADLRLYNGNAETPYALQTSESTTGSPEQIALLNQGRRAGQTVFDAQMPPGSYSDLALAVSGRDFLSTVTVSGSQAQDSAQTRIGAYTIFDLSGQKLGRSTVLHLPSSDYRFLHFAVSGSLPPDSFTGLTVSQRPVVAPDYVTVAESARVNLHDRDSVVSFTLPARVPVDRIDVVPGAEPPAFSRDVEVKVAPIAPPPASAAVNPDAAPPPQPVTAFGNLLRVHRVQNGLHIDEENLTVDPPYYAEFDGPTQWTMTIRNGDDAPIHIASVRLEMRRRTLCFDAAAAAAYTLYYGDSALATPQYDYASLFVQRMNTVEVTAGAEQANPAWQPRPDERPFTEKHPALLWIALGLVVALLGVVALRSVKLTAKASS